MKPSSLMMETMVTDFLICSQKYGELEGAEAIVESRVSFRCACQQVPSITNASHAGQCSVKQIRSPLRHPGWGHRLLSASGWTHIPKTPDAATEAGRLRIACCRIEPSRFQAVPVWWQSSPSRPRQHSGLRALEPVSLLSSTWIPLQCKDAQSLMAVFLPDLHVGYWPSCGVYMQLWHATSRRAAGNCSSNRNHASTCAVKSTGPCSKHKFLVMLLIIFFIYGVSCMTWFL